MEYAHLSSTISVKTVSEDDRNGTFEIEGLYAGYGLTLGNSLRRALLSSLPGSAVTQIKVKNVSHEFSTLPGVKEDMVEMSLNFKQLRFNIHSDQPKILFLKAKGQTKVVAGDIKPDAEVELVNPDAHIATLTAKNAELEIEVTVERGLGYSAVESRKAEKLPIGVIAIDAHFSPVVRVNYIIEDMRVGERTNYNRLRLEIGTDGSLTPSSALHKAATILKDHFEKAGAVSVRETEGGEVKTPAEEKKKRGKKK
ncbi:MAG: DNA-directed RNA polymerase subunit alpha [Patescibacteria group bacterium]